MYEHRSMWKFIRPSGTRNLTDVLLNGDRMWRPSIKAVDRMLGTFSYIHSGLTRLRCAADSIRLWTWSNFDSILQRSTFRSAKLMTRLTRGHSYADHSVPLLQQHVPRVPEVNIYSMGTNTLIPTTEAITNLSSACFLGLCVRPGRGLSMDVPYYPL